MILVAFKESFFSGRKPKLQTNRQTIRIFPGFSWVMFSHVTRLEQSRFREYLMNYQNYKRW